MEAIYCRIKFAVLMCLFFLPIVLTMWNRYLDNQIEQARFLGSPTLLGWSDHTGEEPEQVVDISDALSAEIPDP